MTNSNLPQGPEPVAQQELEEILRLILLSAYILGEKPLSAIIVANVEAGKTMMMERYRTNHGVLWQSDLTAYGLIIGYSEQLKAGLIRHIFCPDLLRVLAHKHETRQQTITFLNGLIEEGVGSMSIGPKIFRIMSPFCCGFVTAIPREVFMDERRNWSKIGFMSRMLPVSFDYSTETARQVMLSICSEDYLRYMPIKVDVPQDSGGHATQWAIHLPGHLSRALVPYSERLAKSEAQDRYGFRSQKQLQRLLKASALERANEVVDEDDLARVIRLSRFLNLNYTKV